MGRSGVKRGIGMVLASGLAVGLWASGEPHGCRGCSAGKLMLRCDYYVAKLGDLSQRDSCADYARVVDIDGASAKAAWYWLLAGEPQKALDAARRAVEQGQTFAAGYAAQALTILGRDQEASAYLGRFRAAVASRDYFSRELRTLARLYPDIDFRKLER